MKPNDIPTSLIKRQGDWLISTLQVCKPVPQHFDLESFAKRLREGYFFMECDDDIGLRSMYAEAREIIPLRTDLDVSADIWRTIKKGNFSVSTDQVFPTVLDACAQPRQNPKKPDRNQDPKDCWLRDRLKGLLCQAYSAGFAHSLEIWRGDELVGGSIGVQTGAVYISLSVFSRHSGAGNAAFLELHNRLLRGGFVMHDSILPSNISRLFGGKLISAQDDFFMRVGAVRKNVAFPTAPAVLPARAAPSAAPV